MNRIPCFLATTVFLAAMFLTGCPKKSVTVDFRADVTSGVIPLNVQFTDFSDPGDLTFTAWHWLFGDDSAGSTEQHPFHTYTKDGVFTVTLTVTTADGRDIATSKTAYIAVAKMIPNITAWPTAHTITFGQTLSAATLTGGTASVDGTFAFEAPAALPDAGIYSAAVKFIPKDTVTYSIVSGTINVTVAKAFPSVTAWPAISDIIYGQPLSASSMTGGVSSVPGTFEFDEPDIVLNAGIHTVEAIFRPANLQNYSIVPGTVNVTVGKATPNVTVWPTPSNITYGQTLASSALHGGTASVQGMFSFDAPATIPSAGTYPAAITFTPTDTVNYMAVSGTVSVTVNKAIPSITAWPTAGTVVSGQPLSSTTLAGGKASVAGSFAFAAPATIPSAGNFVATVIFTPTDIRNYTTVSGSVNVSVMVIVFVRPGASGNGTSWASALSSIQGAINAAGTGEVWVAAGTYRENVTMRNGVKLYGGFVGTESSRDVRNWQTNKTVIDGQKKNRCVNGANNAVIDGFTIQNGTAEKGGGMYNNGVSPTVVNCTFTGNSATSSSGTAANSGGGMYNVNCSPKVTNCTFTGNWAKGNTVFNTGGGGGMFNTGGSPIVSNCTFIGNSAGYASGATGARGGGGMHNDYSSPRVTNCTFSGNTTVKRGGGMYNYYSSPTVTDCIFNENSAQSEGGAMFNSGSSSPAMNYCAFDANSAWQGGAIYSDSCAPKVTSCIFNGNIASSGGGAMNNNMTSSVTVTNCLYIANNADRGGAMYSWLPFSFKMTNCTFSYNAALYGGAIYSGYSSAPKITNCILWGNTATKGGNEIYKDAESGLITVTYSCVKGGHGGTGNISSNPMFVDDVNGDFCLQSGSPCIDTGTSVTAPAKDILGIVRPQGGGHDMGAYELPVP